MILETCLVSHTIFVALLSNMILNFLSYLWRKRTFFLITQEVHCLMFQFPVNMAQFLSGTQKLFSLINAISVFLLKSNIIAFRSIDINFNFRHSTR